MSSLHNAIYRRNFHQVCFLTKLGCDVNRLDSSMRTPMQIVCDLDNESLGVSLGRLLLANGGVVHIKDKFGISVFCYACIKQRVKLVECMIREREISWLDKDYQGNTVLHHAVKTGNTPITNMILQQMRKYGVNIDQRNNRSETALIVAEKLGRDQCAELLRYSGKASTEARDDLMFKNADEWKHAELERVPTKLSSYFSIKFPEVAEQLKEAIDKNPPIRLKKKKETIRKAKAKPDHSEKSVKRDILPKLINLVPEQQMDTFRASTKAPKQRLEQNSEHHQQFGDNEARVTDNQLHVKRKVFSFTDLTMLTKQRWNTRKHNQPVQNNTDIKDTNTMKKPLKRRNTADLINAEEEMNLLVRETKEGVITTIHEEQGQSTSQL